MAATIVQNLPTHPQSRCMVNPNTNTNKKLSGNGCIDYAEFSHSGHQIPASKNILKTSFSKGELRTRKQNNGRLNNKANGMAVAGVANELGGLGNRLTR